MRAALLLLVLAAGCRAPGAAAAPKPFSIGPDLSIPAAPLIIDLPGSQRFRFIAPDSLVRGLAGADLQSATRPEAALLRETVGTVLVSRDWVEVVDSADYDVTVFFIERNATRRETRTEPLRTPPLRQCDATRGERPSRTTCTNNPNPRTERTVSVDVPYTKRVIYHVMRRRADGAVKWWAHELPVEPARAAVALDLMRLLVATDGA